MKLCNPLLTPSIVDGEPRRVIMLDAPTDYAIDIGFPPCVDDAEATKVCQNIVTAVNEREALELVAKAARGVMSSFGLSDDTSELSLALINLAVIQKNNRKS